jgi:hypothetical protein
VHTSFSCLSSFSSTRPFYFTFIHYMDVFSDEGTKKAFNVQSWEVFTKGGYTVFVSASFR